VAAPAYRNIGLGAADELHSFICRQPHGESSIRAAGFADCAQLHDALCLGNKVYEAAESLPSEVSVQASDDDRLACLCPLLRRLGNVREELAFIDANNIGTANHIVADIC